MVTISYIVSSLLFLSGCQGIVVGLIEDKRFNIDTYNYIGNPIGISCVYNENMTGFHQEKINGSNLISAELLDAMNNGKALSLYFDGIFSYDLKSNGTTFNLAREWAIKSHTNVCYLTYGYESYLLGLYNFLTLASKMVQSYRMQYAAKVARDLILGVHERCLTNETPGCLKRMSDVTMLGFSFGAHVASQSCKYVLESTGEKVGKLIGLDPAGVYITMYRYNQAFIGQSDADYVQIIHTDNLFGTIYQCGDVDIYVEDIPARVLKKHEFVPYIHMVTSMKRLILVAENDGNGKIIKVEENDFESLEPLKEDEVYVGVYSELEKTKRGRKFRLSLKDGLEILRESLADTVKIIT